MISFDIPLNKKDNNNLISYLKNTRNETYGRHQAYQCDEIENTKFGFKVSIRNVAILAGVTDLNLGVFSRENINEHTAIGYYEGERIDTTDGHESTYLMKLPNNRYIDGMYRFNWTRFVNHSDFSFNLMFIVEEDRIQLITTKIIKQGEQLLLNYGDRYRFANKYYLHKSHNQLSPLQTVAINENNFIKLKFFDFKKLFKGNIKALCASQCNEVILTTLSLNVLENSELNDAELKDFIEKPSYFFQINTSNDRICVEEVTPLMLACFKGFTENVRVLLQRGADPFRASLIGGRNSFVFTCIGEIIRNREEIFQLLIEHAEHLMVPTFYNIVFIEAQDSDGKNFLEYLCESDLVPYITANNEDEGTFQSYFRDKFLNGEYPGKYSHIIDFLNYDDVNVHLLVMHFSDAFFRNDFRESGEDMSEDDLQINNYLLVKIKIDSTPVGKIHGLLKTCIEKLDDEDKFMEMCTQVFCHCAGYIESKVDKNNISKANAVLSYYQNGITWAEKMTVFSYALQNIIFWHGRKYLSSKWNSKPAAEYLRSKLMPNEYSFIVSKLDSEFRENLRNCLK